MKVTLVFAVSSVALIAGCIGGDGPQPAESTTGQATEVPLSFHVPAQAQGRTAIAGAEWAMIVFSPETQGSLSLQSAGGGEVTHYTDAKYLVDEDPFVHATSTESLTTSSNTLPKPFHAETRHGSSRWSSLFIEAESITLDTKRTQAILGRAQAGDATSRHLPDEEVPLGTFRWPSPRVPVDSVMLGARALQDDLPFTLTAQGLTLAHWYNATVSCTSDGYCPDAPSYQRTPVPGRNNNDVDVRTYTELRVDGATLTGNGSVYLVAVGGSRVDLEIEGAVRLPNTVGNCPLEDCPHPNGQTFTASGILTLKGLAPVDGTQDRVEARMAGELHSVSLDEAKVFGLTPADAALAGAALAATLLVAAKLALALFTRHRRAALEDPKTREVHDAIVARPGLSFNALLRVTRSGSGNLQRHLKRLVSDGAVVARRYRNTVRFYENHGRYDEGWQRHAVLHDDTNRRLHDWIAARPGSTQAQVLAAARSWGVARSTAQNGLKELGEAGLVETQRDGRFVHYRCIPVL